ncbi:hypothetical protein DB346_05995 [Verrucomicrobia bacterium LW23]|nr:hypothetical protein DB346_05995 [Verrucomicrobia bacterium LW23]
MKHPLPLRSLTCAAACTLIAAAFTPARLYAGDIVNNGGFEKGTASWWGGGLKEGGVVAENPAEGAASLRITGDFVCQDKMAIEGGKRYRIQMKVRSQDAPEGSVFVQCSYRGAGLAPEWAGPARTSDGEAALYVGGGTHPWKDVSVVMEAPAGASQILLYLRKKPGTAGEAGFDAVSIEETQDPATVGGPGAGPGEIVRNGDVEKGKVAWWGQGKWEVVEGPGTGGSDGGKALRVDSGFICQDKLPVAARKNYRVSMQIKSDGAPEGTVFVQTSFRGVDGWQGPIQVAGEPAIIATGGTHDWKPFSIVISVPSDATALNLYLRKKDGAGYALYDNVRIEPTEEKAFTPADKRREELAVELLPPAAPGGASPSAVLASLTAGPAAPASRLPLAESGKAVMRLHVATDADVVTLGAARDMARHLKLLTGADFLPLSHDANPIEGPLLVLGRDSALTSKLCPDIPYDKLGQDGFVIRTVGRHIVIAGATPRGTMYGVNWFLDRKLGIRWLSPHYTYVPATAATLSVEPMTELQVPRFEYREVLSDEGSSPAFAAHNLLNGRSHGPSYGRTAPELACWDGKWMAKGGTANFWELIPKKVHGAKHPEWYTGGQVAMMNKAMRAEMAKEVIRRLKAHPDYRSIWFNIWQMDWGWDMDAESAAFAKKHGGHASAPRLDMMIDIANQVRAVLPDARLAFNAYSWGFTPPEGMTVPDYILVFPMTIHVDYSTPLDQGRNEKLGQDITGWTKIARNVLVWDHITNWAGFLQPTPNIYPIGESIQWLSGNPGVHGYFVEGNWNSPGGEFSSLRAWLIARLTWDPTLNVRALITDYCDTYYGKAGPLISQYIDLMHAAAKKSGDILGQRFQVDLPIYDLDFVMAADKLLDRAEEAVAADPERLAHVLQTRMGVDYVVLIRNREYEAEAKKRGIAWDMQLQARRARFDKALADNKVREYRQGGGLKELAELVSVVRKDPTPSPITAGLSTEDWVDIQDLAFCRFGSAWIVADPAASDGAAIRMTGNTSSWNMQLIIERVPKGGPWDIYAEVRVEAEPGHEGETGVRVGSSPPMGLFNTGKIGDLSDGRYHLIKVPGGPFTWRSDDRLRSIYLQSPAKPYIKYIYLDRLVAVRAKANSPAPAAPLP